MSRARSKSQGNILQDHLKSSSGLETWRGALIENMGLYLGRPGRVSDNGSEGKPAGCVVTGILVHLKLQEAHNF